jgi:hypothetical protein
MHHCLKTCKPGYPRKAYNEESVMYNIEERHCGSRDITQTVKKCGDGWSRVAEIAEEVDGAWKGSV